MKQIIKKENIIFLLFMLLGLFPLLDFDIQSKSIILWAFISLILGYSYFIKNRQKINHNIIFVNCGWLIFLLITIIYSSNYINGLSYIRKSLPVIVIPLFLFYFNKPLEKKRTSIFLWLFVIVNIVYVICIYWYLHFTFIEIYKSIYLKTGEFDLFHYINYQLENREYLYVESGYFKFPFFFHKLYFSVGVILSICVLIHKCFKRPRLSLISTSIFITIFLILNLFNFKSSTAIVFLIIIVPAYLLYLILEKINKERLFKYLFCLVIVGGIFTVLFLPSKYQEKFINGFESRQILNKCNISLTLEKPILGYGLGSVQEELNNCYTYNLQKDDRYFYPSKESHNSHNNYFFVFLSGGILALLLFGAMLIYNIRIALLNKDFLYLVFLLLMCFVLFFENFLYRINGILFFTIFNSLFLQKYVYKSTSNLKN